MSRFLLSRVRARVRAFARGAVIAALACVVVSLLVVDYVLACGGTVPIQCQRSTTLTKAFAGPMVIAPAGGVVVIPVTVFVAATQGATPPCPAPVSTTVTLTSMCSLPPASAPGSVVIPTPTPGAYAGAVALFFPAGPPRVCTISGTASTFWADGRTTTGTGDVSICIVDPAPGNPTVPRLNMEILSPASVQAHPGDGRTHIVRVTNNDPANSVSGIITFSADQRARLSTMSPAPPPGSGDGPGSLSTPFTGDALPIDDGDPLCTPCVVLGDPAANSVITFTKPITLAPMESRIVQVRQRSFPMCISGSCSETLMRFDGNFSDASVALACCQASFMVNSLIPPDFEWEDSGIMTRATPSGPMVQYVGTLPTHPVNFKLSYEALLQSPPAFFSSIGQNSTLIDQGYGDNKARIANHFQVSPPLNFSQNLSGQLFVDISSMLPSVNGTLQMLEIHPGEPSLGDTYFYINARSRLSGPAIPPALDSFFDVFFAVSLDGIDINSGHGAFRMFPASVSAVITGPTTLRVQFAGAFPPSPGIGPSFPRVIVHVDAIGTAVGQPPRHDRCLGAYPLTIDKQFSGNTTNAVIANLDGPPSPCGGGMNRTIWHSFTPSVTTNYLFETCGTNFDTVLTVFESPDCATFLPLACNDNAPAPLCTPSALASRIDMLPLTAGQTYWIRVEGKTPLDFGPYKILVRQLLPIGPCCLNGACTITNQPNCPGTWLGPGGTCNPNPCRRGACCSGSACVQVSSDAACVGPNTRFAGFFSVCNAPGNNTSPCCKADFNHVGGVSVQDIFDFLAAWFAMDPRADFNGNGMVSVQDIFDFLAAWFLGCN